MVRIAVEGCAHGELEKIFATVAEINESVRTRRRQRSEGAGPSTRAPAPQHRQRGGGALGGETEGEETEEEEEEEISLLICCGDFQSVRNEDDLECMACPVKYRQLGDFHEYYFGRREPPVPTLFIGGNHEASNYLQELFYGGYVAPNIYYMGQTGCVRFRGLRIAGVSGIYNHGNFFRPRMEAPPYNANALRSVYHVRASDVTRLMRLGGNGDVDVFLSHDWPRGIARFGNLNGLLRRKPFLRDEINDDSLGCPYGRELMLQLRPRYWFSGHLHVKYAAVVRHGNLGNSLADPERPSSRDDQTPGRSSAAATAAAQEAGTMTRFLALDKPLPNRDFLQVLDVAPQTGSGARTEAEADRPGAGPFEYDPEWLAIVMATHGSEFNHERDQPAPGSSRSCADMKATAEQIARAEALVRYRNGDMTIPMEDAFFGTVSSAATHSFTHIHAYTRPRRTDGHSPLVPAARLRL